MSFTEDVKKELAGIIPAKKHCKIAETAGVVLLSGNRHKESLWKIDVDKTDISDIKSLTDSFLEVGDMPGFLEKGCCKRAFLRGAFCAAGSINNPQSGYNHFEINAGNEVTAELLVTIFKEFGVDGKITGRRGKPVVYIKDADMISDALNVMEACVSMMTFENGRILKNVRENINRKVNCETANLQKTVEASKKQCDAIMLIKEKAGLGSLSKPLKELAELRVMYPEKSLSELGELLEPRLGRSGVNHRMEKIIETAEALKC